jgi:exosome complex component RRP46
LTRKRLIEHEVMKPNHGMPLIIRTHHPRTLLQINIQLIETVDHTDTTSLLPVCINAATLALIDAGTPLKNVLVATTVECDRMEEGGKIRSRHVVAFTNDGSCVFADSVGCFDEDEFARAVDWGRKACMLTGEGPDLSMGGTAEDLQVGEVVRKAIEGKASRDMKWREL